MKKQLHTTELSFRQWLDLLNFCQGLKNILKQNNKKIKQNDNLLRITFMFCSNGFLSGSLACANIFFCLPGTEMIFIFLPRCYWIINWSTDVSNSLHLLYCIFSWNKKMYILFYWQKWLLSFFLLLLDCVIRLWLMSLHS